MSHTSPCFSVDLSTSVWLPCMHLLLLSSWEGLLKQDMTDCCVGDAVPDNQVEGTMKSEVPGMSTLEWRPRTKAVLSIHFRRGS